MTFLDGAEHIVGYALTASKAVFESKTLYIAYLNSAALYLICKELFAGYALL